MLLYLAHVFASNLYETMIRNVKLMGEEESFDTLVTFHDVVIDLFTGHYFCQLLILKNLVE